MGTETDIKQRTSEWLQQRLGKFTASTATSILGTPGAMQTEAMEKAIESFSGIIEDGFCSYDMQIGIDREPFAFKKFAALNPFFNVTECGFFTFGEHCGASPDGLVNDDAILEIKCPKKETFFKLVATQEIDKKHLAQIQVQLLATNRQRAYYFNYYIFDGVEYWHTITVERDEVFIANYLNKLADAIVYKTVYIELLKTNQQWPLV